MSFNPHAQVKILREGPAARVMFYYPGEEGTYVDNPHVTLFENGILHVKGKHEETTTSLQNCEVLWEFQSDEDRPAGSNVRLLRNPKDEEPNPPNN